MTLFNGKGGVSTSFAKPSLARSDIETRGLSVPNKNIGGAISPSKWIFLVCSVAIEYLMMSRREP